jgi:hypothetical protein
VPVVPNGKHPLVAWRDYQRKRATPDEVRSWYAQWPNANVGIITGQISNLVVIDVDPAHKGEQSLAELTERYGALPETLTACSGGGGRHLYFAAPADPVAVRSRVAVAPGIDVRAEGGMVVAPPSNHPSGGRYRWLTGAHFPEKPAPLPRWLIDLVQGTRPHAVGHGVRHWRRLAAEGVSEGERNSSLAAFTGHLLWCGVDIEVIKELLLCWNRVRARPPLDEEEVIGTIESIQRTHERHLQAQ